MIITRVVHPGLPAQGLENLQLGSKLGSGSFGEVSELVSFKDADGASHPSSGQEDKYAVKLIKVRMPSCSTGSVASGSTWWSSPLA